MWKHPSTSQNCMATIIHCLLEKDIEINVEPKKNHRHEDWLYLDRMLNFSYNMTSSLLLWQWWDIS